MLVASKEMLIVVRRVRDSAFLYSYVNLVAQGGKIYIYFQILVVLSVYSIFNGLMSVTIRRSLLLGPPKSLYMTQSSSTFNTPLRPLRKMHKIHRQHLFLFILSSFISKTFGIFFRGNSLIRMPSDVYWPCRTS